MFKFFMGFTRGYSASVGQSISIRKFLSVAAGGAAILVHTPAIWKQLAAAIIVRGFPIRSWIITAGQRLAGKSSMNLVSLSGHGSSALLVFTIWFCYVWPLEGV